MKWMVQTNLEALEMRNYYDRWTVKIILILKKGGKHFVYSLNFPVCKIWKYSNQISKTVLLC